MAGVVLVVAVGALGWMGALSGVKVTEQEMGPYSFVYVQDTTTDAGRVAELTEALGARLESAGFTQRQPAQIYYPTGRGLLNQIGFMVDRTVPFELLGADTFFRPIPAQRVMVARFPFRNALSYAVGALRVDPAFRKHRRQNKYAETHAIVIHEGDSILYLQPIAPG